MSEKPVYSAAAAMDPAASIASTEQDAEQHLLAIGSDAGFQRTDRNTGCGHGHAPDARVC